MNLFRSIAGTTLALVISSCAGKFAYYPGEKLVYRSQDSSQEQNTPGEAYAAVGCLTALLGASVYAGYSFHETPNGLGTPVAGVATFVGGMGIAQLADLLGKTKEEKVRSIAYGLCLGALAGTTAATIYELKKMEENSLIPVKLHQE